MCPDLRERELLEPADVRLNAVRLFFQMPQPPKVVTARGAVSSGALPVEVVVPPLLWGGQWLATRTLPGPIAMLADANVRKVPPRHVPTACAVVGSPLDGFRSDVVGLPLPLKHSMVLVPWHVHPHLVVQASDEGDAGDRLGIDIFRE